MKRLFLIISGLLFLSAVGVSNASCEGLYIKAPAGYIITGYHMHHGYEESGKNTSKLHVKASAFYGPNVTVTMSKKNHTTYRATVQQNNCVGEAGKIHISDTQLKFTAVPGSLAGARPGEVNFKL